MIFTATRLADAFVIDVEFHADERGFLARTFCERGFAEHGLPMRLALPGRRVRRNGRAGMADAAVSGRYWVWPWPGGPMVMLSVGADGERVEVVDRDSSAHRF